MTPISRQLMPGLSRSMMKAVIPSPLPASPVRAKTMPQSALSTPVIHIFEPLTT